MILIAILVKQHYAVISLLVRVHKVFGCCYRFMLLIRICFQPFKVGVRQKYSFLDLTAFGVVIGSLVYQLTVHIEFVHSLFLLSVFFHRQQAWSALYVSADRHTNRSQRLYLLSVVSFHVLTLSPSKTAHKSLIGVLSLCWQETKKDSIPAFPQFVKTTKTEPKTLYTIFHRQNRDLPVFQPLEGTVSALLRVQILTNG